ncbi:MAG: hypothetical protein PHR26_00780 [Candidatus ainarchaeum sp.]|nr:hypothetical protein [Candidatus ainarchaeum sp.]MDD3976231.1 hypothetical protein [Candidatus ainarchaeum sp.]
MNKLYRKDLMNMQTRFLVKIKKTLLKRMEFGEYMTKKYNNMLIDILGELESRSEIKKAN